MKNRKRRIAWILSVLMILSVCVGEPLAARAANDKTTIENTSGGGIEEVSEDNSAPSQSSEEGEDTEKEEETSQSSEEAASGGETDPVSEETVTGSENTAVSEETASDGETDSASEETASDGETDSASEKAAQENADAGIMLLGAEADAGIVLLSVSGTVVDGSSLVTGVTLTTKDGTEIKDGSSISLSDMIYVNITLCTLVSVSVNGTVNYVAGSEYTLFTMPDTIAKPSEDDTEIMKTTNGTVYGTLNYYTGGSVSLTAAEISSGNNILTPTLSVGAYLSADKIGDAEEAKIKFEIAGKEYSFTVKISENEKTSPTMTKEYVTDDTDSTIQHWTVTVTEGSKVYENGWIFQDTIGGDLEYYERSWLVTPPTGGSAGTLSVSDDNKTISCELTPSGNKDAVWTITYDTQTVSSSITTSAGTAKITSTIKNDAKLYDAGDMTKPLFTASKSATEEKDALTVTKASKQTENSDGSVSIDYTITVSADGYTFSNVIVYDYVEGAPVTASKANLKFDAGTINSADGTVTYADSTGYVATTTVTENDSNTNTSQTYSMKVVFDTISGSEDYVITYSVYVDNWEAYRKYNESAVNNYAWMTFATGDGKTYAVPRINSGGETLVAGSLEKSKGTYNASTNEITWTITVNSEKSKIGDVVIEDIISGSGYGNSSNNLKEQEYVRYQNLLIDGSKPESEEGFADISTSGKVRFTFSDGLNLDGHVATFEVVTRPTDPNYYQNNLKDTSTFGNTANLYMGTDAQTAAITVNAFCSPTSTVLTKSAGDYNYGKNTIPWTITVNTSQMALGSPVITDTLPEGLSLVDGTLKVDGVLLSSGNSGSDSEYYTYNNSTGVITVYLKSAVSGDSPRTITFDSLVDVENAVFDGNAVKTHNGNITVTNNVSLDTDERNTPVEVSTPYTWDNQLLGKTGTPDLSGNIAYAVVINKTGIKLAANTVVTDTLSSGLTLSPSSIALYQATIASDGSYTKGDAVTDWSYDTASGTDGSTILYVTLPGNAGTSAYLLTYSARVSDAEASSYSNSITMDGLSNNSGAVAVSTAKSDMFAKGSADEYNPSGLQILAEDTDGNMLPGATYTLSYDSHVLAEDTTGSTGTLTYRAVDLDEDYVVMQIEAPEGYELVRIEQRSTYGTVKPDEENASATLQVEAEGSTKMTQVAFIYALKSTELSFTKVNESGEALSGAVFTLYTVGTDDALTEVATAESDSDGKVSFTGVTVGEYRILETTAPDGYLKSSEQIVAVVNANAEITAFYLLGDGNETTVTTYENEAKQAGTVSITVRSKLTGALLSGATFALYSVTTTTDDNGEEIETEEYVTETTSDENGRVTFTGLLAGTYKILQTAAPYAYTYDADLTLVAVLEDDADGDAMLTALYVDGDDEKEEVSSVYDTMLPTTDVTFVSVSSVDGSRLAGALFGLYMKTVSADGTVSWSLLFTATSAADGTVAFSGIAEGDYEIRLISEPAGYSVVEDTPIVLSVNEDGELETFYFKGGEETNLLAGGGTVEVPFYAEKTDNPTTSDLVSGIVSEEEEDSEEDSDESGGTWDTTHTYLVSPKTGK